MEILDARSRTSLASLLSLLSLLMAGCPGQSESDDSSTSTGTSEGSTTPTSTTASTTASTTSTTSAASTAESTAESTADSTAGSTSGSTASDTSGTTTGAVDTTGGDWTSGPIDPTCTNPGSTSEGPLTPDVAPECACVDDQGSLLCAAPLCPSLGGNDEAALDCALAAARDGLEGTLQWYASPDGGFTSHDGFLHIVSGRRAIRQDVYWQDLSGEVSDTQLWQLAGPAYFQGCIDLPTFCARFSCFFAGTTGSALSLCLPGFNKRGF